MLIGFNFANIYSYKDENVLSMMASKLNEFPENTFEIRNMDLLKFISIYGKNASGKSNIFKALRFMQKLILNSNKFDAGEEIFKRNFKLNSESENIPAKFELAFIIDSVIYKYGFKILNNEIVEEWLDQSKKRFTPLFYRSSPEGESIEIGNSFKEGKSIPKNQVRRNGLFLPLVAVFNGDISNKIMKWIRNINIMSGEKFFYDTTINMSENKKHKKSITNFLKIADLGINDFIIEEMEIPEELRETLKKFSPPSNENNFKSFTLKTIHSKYNNNYEHISNEEFDLEAFESEGTKKFFSLAGPILDALEHGKILFIDELDSKLHPLMVRYLINFFNSNEKNPNNAQLIINTHNVNLMRKDILRRDQIWFVEKNNFGESELYSLDEYKNEKTNSKIRNDEAYEKNYLLGKYGAIPNFHEEYFILNHFYSFLGGK